MRAAKADLQTIWGLQYCADQPKLFLLISQLTQVNPKLQRIQRVFPQHGPKADAERYPIQADLDETVFLNQLFLQGVRNTKEIPDTFNRQ